MKIFRRLFVRHLLLLPLLAFAACDAGETAIPSAPLVPDGARTVLNLAGTWEARPGDWMLPFPPPEDGWKPHAVPHQENNLIDSDNLGPYFPQNPEAMFEADLKTPKRKDKLAAWFRRSGRK